MSLIKICSIIRQWNFTDNKCLPFVICMAFFPQTDKPVFTNCQIKLTCTYFRMLPWRKKNMTETKSIKQEQENKHLIDRLKWEAFYLYGFDTKNLYRKFEEVFLLMLPTHATSLHNVQTIHLLQPIHGCKYYNKCTWFTPQLGSYKLKQYMLQHYLIKM